jgi:hypothetical protein
MKCICKARPLPARPTAGLQLDFSSKGSRNDGIKEWERGTTVPECHFFKKKLWYKRVYTVSSSGQALGEEEPASVSPPSSPSTRPKRVRRPSSRVVGLAWINP